MKIKMFLWLAFFAIFLVPAPAADHKGFEGKWVLDEKNSSAEPMLQNLEQQIKEDGNQYKIRSTWRELKTGVAPVLYLGIMHTDLTLANDGSEAVNHIGPYEHRAKTILEGNRMVTDWVAGMRDGQPVTGQWVREVSPDGKQMTLQIKTSINDGRSNEARLVFKRK
jgi:hypothetical protein